MTRLNGTEVSLNDLRGKVVFLNLWQTTCPPCVAELPAIERLSRDVRGDEVEFIAASPEAPETVRAFLKRHPVAVSMVTFQRSPEDFGFGGYPRTFIFDRNGVMVSRYEGPYNWSDSSAKEYLLRLAHSAG